MPGVTVTPDALVIGISDGAAAFPRPTIIASVPMIVYPDPVIVGTQALSASPSTDNGDYITYNAGLIFTENNLTRLSTDAQLANVLGIKFSLITKIRSGNPAWKFKRYLDQFAKAFGLSPVEVRANFERRVQLAHQQGGLSGTAPPSWAWTTQAASGPDSTFMGLGDKPVEPSAYETGDPYVTKWYAGTAGFESAPGVSSSLPTTSIARNSGAFHTYIDVEGGRLYMTLDDREVTLVQYDLIIGPDPSSGGGGSGGEMRIDEFDPGTGFDDEDAERFAAFGFCRSSIAAPRDPGLLSYGPFRVHPKRIKIMADRSGVVYQVRYEQVGDSAYGR